MDLQIVPSELRGAVTVPPSKSVAHRMIIAAALADGVSRISNLYPSVDILATMDCMRSLGAKIDFGGDIAVIEGIKSVPDKAVLDCHESGSTLRFLIPVACALGVNAEFIGSGKLPQRPITTFTEELPRHGITFDFSDAKSGDSLPCRVSGKLSSGCYQVDGSVSSQFITGLLFALTLTEVNSEIAIINKFNSKPYVDITLDVLRAFGSEIHESENKYQIHGGKRLKPHDSAVEGDYSQAAFFYVANALGANLKIHGLNEKSSQGDKKIVEICNDFTNTKNPFELDCSDIPDLVPILAVLASFCHGKSRLTNVARLRIKECDRLAAMETCLNHIGGRVSASEDCLEIEGVESLSGGEVECFNDHRIAMSMAIAATRCKNPLIIRGAECVRKSFPNFFDVYGEIGGRYEEI
ncbi:MAG: 3-phosphoshikimate 1-carboxyvinyltransferase [Oscillospiraceae bacterium]|nr:3-phosphoshikimate 1-carboxyvinyltransferase [Oscillospiraceae bacterium]